jgi:Transglycosylase SLT domain
MFRQQKMAVRGWTRRMIIRTTTLRPTAARRRMPPGQSEARLIAAQRTDHQRHMWPIASSDPFASVASQASFGDAASTGFAVPDLACRRRRNPRQGLRAVALAVLLATGPAALADLWGYVDEAGVAHVATERVDARYLLFFHGGTRVDPPDAVAVAEAEAREAFRNTPIFQRMTAHPNVRRFDPLIEQQAKAQKLDPALVKALIAVESGFDPAAVSPKGALGLMQIIPDTARRYRIAGDRKHTLEQKLLDPVINVRVGTRYLHDLLALFAGDLRLALAAYNAGEGAVSRHDNNVPPYAETEDYVKLVQQFYSLYRPPPAPLPTLTRIVVPGQRKRPGAAGATAPALDADAASR